METPVVSPPFGVIVPGRPLLSQFAQVEPTKWLTEITQANTIRSMTVILTQPISNPGLVISVYISPPPYNEWVYLGHMSNQSPSQTFDLLWPRKYQQNVFTAQVGFIVESAENITSKVSPFSREEEYKMFIKFIGDDLFLYLESFNKRSDNGEFLLLPTKALDMWYEKFQNKFKRDPFFWTKPKDMG
eukprot:TRINITY_DN12940_c0_g1_i1.p1 TRINITY_DN12940_c0_g1~~TRINITY_DN12940_c0_g1_i1.p1  ORF type:complete len:187 (+),score=20.44 TRINITY_DN12940_c0_g1_i1:190-750(+)